MNKVIPPATKFSIQETMTCATLSCVSGLTLGSDSFAQPRPTVLPFGINLMDVSNKRALTGLRVAVGILFLIFAEYKVFGTQFTLGGGFQYWINRFLQDGAYPFMVPLLKNFVLPHAVPIAFLVAYGELAIGIGLVLGILVRPARISGVIYMFMLLFSANYPGPHAAFWQYFGASLEHLVLALCFASFASTKPQEILSIRTYLRSRPSV